MRILVNFIFWFYTASSFGQGIVESVVEPVINDSLLLRPLGEQMVCIVNDNNIIYQDNTKRIYIDADPKTFHFPQDPFYQGVAIDKNGIYYKEKLITKDTIGFRFIYKSKDLLLWSSGTKVYRDSLEIAGADASTYSSVGCSGGLYYVDKNFIYYNHIKIGGSDGASVVTKACDNFCYDKNNVYIDGKIAYYNGKRLLPINDRLVKTQDVVYDRFTMKSQPHMDAPTIKRLSAEHYALDKERVFYDTITMPFAKKDIHKVKVWDRHQGYSTDGKNIYQADGYIIRDGDPRTFGLVPLSGLFYDKNGIYEWFYDKETNTRMLKKLPFKYNVPVIAKNIFPRQGNYRYIVYGNQAIDLGTNDYFENLTSEQVAQFVKGDKIFTKHNGRIVEKVFYAYNVYEIEGKIYCNDKITNADADTFSNLGYIFKDKDHVYSVSREGLVQIAGMDAASAEPFNGFIRDKNFIFWSNQKIISRNKAEIIAVFTPSNIPVGHNSYRISNMYLFRNTEGFWIVEIDTGVTLRYLGNNLSEELRNRIGPVKTD